MNEWLSVAPLAEVMHGRIGCMVSLNDITDRTRHMLADGEVVGPRRWPSRALPEYAPLSRMNGRQVSSKRRPQVRVPCFVETCSPSAY